MVKCEASTGWRRNGREQSGHAFHGAIACGVTKGIHLLFAFLFAGHFLEGRVCWVSQLSLAIFPKKRMMKSAGVSRS